MLLGCGGFTISYQSDFQHFGKSPTTEADIVLFFRQISGILSGILWMGCQKMPTAWNGLGVLFSLLRQKHISLLLMY